MAVPTPIVITSITSLLNLTPLSALTRGVKIADVVSILGSIDLTMGEVDR